MRDDPTLQTAGASTFVDDGPGMTLASVAPRCVPGIAAVSRDVLLQTGESAAA